jgi:hypothetical protein
MSTQVTVFNPRAGLPAHLQGVSVDGYQRFQSTGVPYGTLRIKTDPKTKLRFFAATPPNGGQEQDCGSDVAMCVVSHPKVGRMHFNKPYDEAAVSGSTFIDCWSTDGSKPDLEVARPHALSCASCPFSVSKTPNQCANLMPIVFFFLADPDRHLYRLDAKSLTLFNMSATANQMNKKGGADAGWMPFIGTKAEPGLIRSLPEGTEVSHFVVQAMINVLDNASASFRLVDWLPKEHVDFLTTIKYSDYELMSRVNPLPNPKALAPGMAQAPVAQAPVAQAPVAQAPVAQAPVAHAPVAQAPVATAPSSVPFGRPTFLGAGSPAAVASKDITPSASPEDFDFLN